MTGHVCPECGGQRPGCACYQAEVAAAEDFDPLRIRPYVTLEEPGEGGAPAAEPGEPPVPVPVPPPTPTARQDAAETMPLLLPGIADAPEPVQEEPYGTEPYGSDPYDADPYGAEAYEPERPVTRRRGALVALAAAVAVAVVATAAIATGLLGDGGTDDRAAVPTPTASASENVVVSEAPSSPSSSPPPSPKASASRSASPSASPTASTRPPEATPTGTGTATTPTGRPTPSATRTTTTPTPTRTPTEATPGPTLRYGDTGAEVEELQRRLKQVYAYDGSIDGTYSGRVRRAVEWFQSYQYIEEDEEGVYGPETRRALEAQTTG
ncbi:peptidoglycan-binding protein [Streptomyces sp. NPDC058579]|uniref:peptidoglycan-binding domain-containing protein n=1 Tax=Streptomyces sp. NPDC058579 TaxID=3346548 RepID=UPI00365138B2